MTRIGPLVLVLLALTAPVAVHAQQWGVTAVLRPHPEARVSVLGVPREGGDVDAFAVLGADPAAGAAVRWTDAVGPLGTLVIEADTELRFGDPVAGRASAGVRAVLGPVAARVRIGVDGAPPERFTSGEADRDAPYARGASLRLAVDGRASRSWVISGVATAWRDASGALTYDVDAAARARGALRRELDARIALETRFATGGPRLGLGVGAVHAPRRAPEVSATVWLDLDRAAAGAVRARPGLEAAGAWRSGSDRVDVALRARPGDRAQAAWSVDLSWRRSLDDGEVTLQAVGSGGEPNGARLELRIGYRAPLGAAAR